MWTRADLKNKAEESLHGTYWISFCVTSLAVILGLNISSFLNLRDSIYISKDFQRLLDQWLWLLLVFFTLLPILVGNIIEVGKKHFFLQNHFSETRFGNMFYGFRNSYKNILLAQLTTTIIILLWSFLFFIPGIVVGYKYSMVPYLLSENPNLKGTDARALSARMTQGQKVRILGLDLSFLGLFLVGMLCLMVGVLFVTPYYEATKAELYLSLRDSSACEANDSMKRGGHIAAVEP